VGVEPKLDDDNSDDDGGYNFLSIDASKI